MKNKIFIPCSVGFILVNFILFGFLGLVIYFVTINIILRDIESIILGVFVLGFFSWSSLRFLFALKITLKKDKLTTYGDMLPEIEKIQYKTSINYIDILSIEIIESENNSKDEVIKKKWISSSMPKKYLEFHLCDNKKARLYIVYYTKKQICKMLSIISERMKAVGNSNEINIESIMKNWKITTKEKKEQV